MFSLKYLDIIRSFTSFYPKIKNGECICRVYILSMFDFTDKCVCPIIKITLLLEKVYFRGSTIVT